MTTGDELLGGRYRLGPLIGHGGMADVFSAEDTLLGRDVAVKMMRADMARDAGFVERFRREALNAAKLNHPAIVSVFDTGATPGAVGEVPYIVMELVRGENLRDLVRREGPLAPTRAAGILAEVCDALHFSHAEGIVHRDIKPANIMITATGAVKVMDFGIARALGDATNMTQTSAVIGTAQYLSPEQARGRAADGRSDIYAAGCVLYEALTGRPPFTGENSLAVAYQHVQDPPESPSLLLPGLGAAEATAVDAITLTALAKDPADRYDTAALMAEDLRRLGRGEVPLAAAHHIPPHAARGDDAATTEFAPQRPAAPAPAQPAAPRRARRAAPAKRRLWPVVALLAVLALVGGGGALWVLGGPGDASGDSAATVTVPDVAGKGAAEAERILAAADLEVIREDVADPEVPRSRVIGTDPGPRAAVPAGSPVTMRVSAGPEAIRVPDVVELTAEAARRKLTAAGLKVDTVVEEEPSDTVPAGAVVAQEPKAGRKVSKGTTARLTVSTGKAESTVPDVTGQDLDGARATLEDAGFRVVVVEVDSVEPAGRVLSTDNAGARQEEGSEVRIRVSRGNQMRMPYLMGKTAEQAESELRAAGFTGEIRRGQVNTPDVRQLGMVASQSPAPDTTIDKDGAVDIEVYVLGL